MRKMLFPMMVAGSLLLGGCASGLGGNPMAGILGSVLGGVRTQGYGNQNYGNDQFERAAVNACAQQASQYGRASITDVRETRGDTVRVDGRINANDGYRRQFTCAFRSDGRIVDFRVG